MRRVLARLISVFRPERGEADLEREIAAHLALLEDEYRRRGMSDEDARVAAHRALGGTVHAADRHRDARSFVWLDDLRRDLAHGARALRRNPGFAAIAIVTLALAIGANTAIFSVISTVLLRPLPYADADRLVQVFATFPDRPAAEGPRRTSPQPWSFDTLRLGSRALAHVTGYVLTTATLTGQGDAVRLTGVESSASLFPLLGAAPQIGRLFTSREEAAGTSAVVVLSHAAWQQYFNGDAVVGRTIALDGQGRTIVGVMPKGFAFPDPTVQYWSPYVVPPRGTRSYLAPAVIAHLQPGATRADAEREVNTLIAKDGWTGARYQLVGMQDDLVAPVRPALLMLVGAVGMVLLIACVNVANLLLVRTASREIEIALRRAIGASPGRLVRQLLTESTLLALLGALGGTVLAYGGIVLVRVLATTLPRRDLGQGITLPRVDEITIDARVLLFTIAIALSTGVVCGLIPALRHSKPSRADVLRERAASPRIGGTLVVVEIAMAMMLLVGGGLLIQSFVRLSTMERGYDASNVVTFQAAGRQTLGPQARAFAGQLVERIAALPGVSAVGYANNLPLVQQGFGRDVSPQPPARGQQGRRPQPGVHAVSPDFARAIGLRIVEGRGFSDGEDARREALVTRAFARSGFFDGPAIGSHIYTGRNDYEVVGVLEDLKQFSLQQQPSPELFIVDFIAPPPGLGGTYFAVRTSSDPAAFNAAVRQLVRDLDLAATVDNIATMEQIVSNAMQRPRLFAVLLGVFAAVAVVLAAVGLYGVLAFSVTRRTREIGIRIALGAQRSQVIALILRHTALLTGVGIVIGVASAAAVSRYLEGLLFGVTPLDTPTFAFVVILFIVVATFASLVPARRATRVDPHVALRAE